MQAGMFLVATPALRDPQFADSVVLLLDVAEDGVLGVVLNRPTGVAVGQVLPAWSELVAEPEVLFQGGPVETDGALAVVLRRSDDETPGLRAVVDRLALLDLDTPVELVGPDLEGLRIFAGYSGWGGGQLESEIDEGSWYVVPGSADDIFRTDTSGLWRDVLRRQPGDLAMHSTWPTDPALN